MSEPDHDHDRPTPVMLDENGYCIECGMPACDHTHWGTCIADLDDSTEEY